MNYHIIQGGETLSLLSKMYNVSKEAIAMANPEIDLDYLMIGQILLIPLISNDEIENTIYY